MPCYKPLQGWLASTPNASGKRGVVFSVSQGFIDKPMEVPCGQCIGCRLERSRQWAVRLMHEKQLHEHAWFVTLTYADKHLPPGMSLDRRDMQLFFKRLRKSVGSVRYLYCGEYGDTTSRPHYHAIIFGPDFPDRRIINRKDNGDLYESAQLTEIWGLGHVWIGAVTFESAAYVARYVVKKVTGDKAAEHYRYTHPDTGEIFDREPEYINMSRRPGIGKDWYEKFEGDVFPRDHVVLGGKASKPPRYYDRQLEAGNPKAYRKIKSARTRASLKRAADNTPERLRVKEEVRLAQYTHLKRDSV